MKIKIVFMTNGFFENEQLQFQFLNYARYLPKESFQLMMLFVFFSSESSKTVKELKREGVIVKSLNSKKKVSLYTIAGCLKVFKEFMPDIIHSHHPIAGVNGRIAGLFYKLLYNRRLKIISEQRNERKGFSWKARILEYITFPIANLILCSSQEVEKSFFKDSMVFDAVKLKYTKRKHYTFYNSIDVDTIQRQVKDLDRHYYRKEYGIKDKELLVISVGRLTRQKGYNFLIEALGLLNKKNYIKFKLFLIGEGLARECLEIQIDKLGLNDKVCFLGYRNDVYKLLYISDIYVISSLWEGLPKALLEAMSLGLPCVATSVGGNKDVIRDGEDGLLVPPKNSEKLCDAIEHLIKNEKLRDKLAVNAKKRASLFSVKEKAKNIEKIYNTLLSEKNIFNA